jgi:geranylgeranyl diphosphate synthase type II
MDSLKQAIEQKLMAWTETIPSSFLKEATQYALQGKAKRFRPLVVLRLIESYGLDPFLYLDIAVALEMIHVYSLIHDDLPAMDDDSLRHGRPTLHLAFDEANAILVGDGLLTLAFEIIAKTTCINDAQKVKVIQILSSHAGLSGMIYGQHLDLLFEKRTPNQEELQAISRHKTGMLLSAAFQLGALVGNPQNAAIWEEIGHDLGLLFQIQDDVLEATTSSDKMGKSKSDDLLEKATFVKILGLDASQQKIASLTTKIKKDIQRISLSSSTIIDLINTILTRQY